MHEINKIVGGVPARIIKYRFLSEIINTMMNVDFNNLDRKTFKDNLNIFNQEIKSLDDVKKFWSQ